MSLHNYISNDLPTVKPTDTGAQILDLMQEWKIPEIALVQDDKYLALIRENDLLDWGPENNEIASAGFLSFRPVALNLSHPYNAAARMVELDISVLPVIDDGGNFLGVLTRAGLLDFFCENSGLNHPGGIIILNLLSINYSLSEIARICENNDATILNLQIFSATDHDRIDVVLKTNTKNLQALKASFERYDYNIKEVYDEIPIKSDLEARYKLLMNYINM